MNLTPYFVIFQSSLVYENYDLNNEKFMEEASTPPFDDSEYDHHDNNVMQE